MGGSPKPGSHVEGEGLTSSSAMRAKLRAKTTRAFRREGEPCWISLPLNLGEMVGFKVRSLQFVFISIGQLHFCSILVVFVLSMLVDSLEL